MIILPYKVQHNCMFSFVVVVDIPPSNFSNIAVTNAPFMHPMITVSKQGTFHAIKINHEAYKKRIELCQHSLIVCIILRKGEVPWTLSKLKEKLTNIWNLKLQWHLISLDRGFYHILLHSSAAKDLVWNKGSVSLKPGVL